IRVRAYPYDPRRPSGCANSLYGVHDQIHYDLLQLSVVALDQCEIIQKSGLQRDLVSLQLRLHQPERIDNQAIEIDEDHLRGGSARLNPYALYDFRHPMPVLDDSLRSPSRLI